MERDRDKRGKSYNLSPQFSKDQLGNATINGWCLR
jgi:hypothetical protein